MTGTATGDERPLGPGSLLVHFLVVALLTT